MSKQKPAPKITLLTDRDSTKSLRDIGIKFGQDVSLKIYDAIDTMQYTKEISKEEGLGIIQSMLAKIMVEIAELQGDVKAARLYVDCLIKERQHK